MRKSLSSLLTIFILIACEYNDLSDKTPCRTNDPANDIAWLKAEIQQLEAGDAFIREYFYIREGTYLGRTVFVTMNCCPMCNTEPPIVKNCSGQALFNFMDPRAQQVILSKVIWKTSDFACIIN
jgi:hypothetical protein